LPDFHFRPTAARDQAGISAFFDTTQTTPFRGMYQRFDKLFFKHSYTIAHQLSGTFSSLTTDLSKIKRWSPAFRRPQLKTEH
jgi:hypothetical protein